MLAEDEPTGREADKPIAGKIAPLPLDTLGIAELRAYIEELRAEISRVEATLALKEGHRSAADAIFRKS